MSITASTPYRKQTRMERYHQKIADGARRIPVQVCCINFGKEVNLAAAYRSAACFGAEIIHLVGNCDMDRTGLRAISGTTCDLTDVIVHKTPVEFIDWCRANDIDIVSLELPEDPYLPAQKLHDYSFNFEDNKKTVLVAGHETAGVPMEILKASDILYIETFGPAYCLNTSQALNTGLYEYSRQYSNYQKENI